MLTKWPGISLSILRYVSEYSPWLEIMNNDYPDLVRSVVVPRLHKKLDVACAEGIHVLVKLYDSTRKYRSRPAFVEMLGGGALLKKPPLDAFTWCSTSPMFDF